MTRAIDMVIDSSGKQVNDMKFCNTVGQLPLEDVLVCLYIDQLYNESVF